MDWIAGTRLLAPAQQDQLSMGPIALCRCEGVAGLTGKDADRMKFKLPILPPSTNDTPKPKPFG